MSRIAYLIHNICFLVASYTKFAAQITINLITPKKEFEEPYYNLIKPFSALLWGVTGAVVGLVLLVSPLFTNLPPCS